MIAQFDFRKWTRLVPCVLSVSIALAAPVLAQEPPAPRREVKAEIKAVVRISKALIDEVVASQDVAAKIPLNAIILRIPFTGLIDGRGKLAAELQTQKGDGLMTINGQGPFEVCARGERGPIVVWAPTSGTFTSRTCIRFDGRKFFLLGTTACTDVHIEVERIEGRRGTRAGDAFGKMLLPTARLLIPRAERQATPVGNNYIVEFVNGLSEKIIAKLNRTTRVEESLNRLFPETQGWEFQLSTDPGFVQAAYGPHGSEVPTMPDNPGRLENTRLEVWLRATTKGGEALEKLSKQPLAKPLIQRYLEATLPELAAMTEERSVTFVNPWVVICIGKPKAEQLK
jgi:hypothetical protein